VAGEKIAGTVVLGAACLKNGVPGSDLGCPCLWGRQAQGRGCACAGLRSTPDHPCQFTGAPARGLQRLQPVCFSMDHAIGFTR